MRVLWATTASMIGWIVFCWTLASICSTTCPPRWISPRIGGLSFSSVPRPGAPASRRRRPRRPFLRLRPVGPCARPRRTPRRSPPHLPVSPPEPWPPVRGQLLGHELHVRACESKLQGDLSVGEAQAHEVKAQHPDPQRLVVARQHRAGQVVEATRASLAPIALPVRLRVIAAVAYHGVAAASGAANALRPAMLPHQGEALGVIDQRRQVDQVRCSHGDKRSCKSGELPSRFYHPSIFPPRASCRPLSTPDPGKSLTSYEDTNVIPDGPCAMLRPTACQESPKGTSSSRSCDRSRLPSEVGLLCKRNTW